jgi:hypothetical protein
MVDMEKNSHSSRYLLHNAEKSSNNFAIHRQNQLRQKLASFGPNKTCAIPLLGDGKQLRQNWISEQKHVTRASDLPKL